MTRALPRLSLVALLALSACAGSPPPPDWKVNTQSGLEAFEKHYLDGNSRLADLNFAKARAEATRTGRPDMVARVELARCGIRAAALEFDDCPGYQALKDGAGPEERSYADFLAGNWQTLAPKSLPPAYAAIVKTGGEADLAAIEDPASRLIAAGLLLKSGRITPSAITVAVDTASERGWRRPLLAWLGVLLKRAESAGDTLAAGSIRQRIELVSGAASDTPPRP